MFKKSIQNLTKSIPEHWQSNTWLSKSLTPIAIAYAQIVKLREQIYARKKGGKKYLPVIVVGNPTLGGVGKTPLVLWLAQKLIRMGLKPAIITRGYKGQSEYWPLEVKKNMHYQLCGDEPLMMAWRFNSSASCPVIAAPKRVHSLAYLKDHYPDTDIVISDDGLQHYAMLRDIEVIVLDAKRKLGNGKFFPAGPLRESLETMQKRLKNGALLVENFAHYSSDVVLDVESDNDTPDSYQQRFKMQYAGGMMLRVNQPIHRLRLVNIKKIVKINAIAAIGNPNRFFDFLEKLGFVIAEKRILPDHAFFNQDDLIFDNSYNVLVTEKDAVKCIHIAHDKCWYLPIHAVLSNDFEEKIESLVVPLVKSYQKQKLLN